MTVLAIYNAVRLKGQNLIHLADEMLCNKKDFPDYKEMVNAGKLTHQMIDNILIAKYTGLVAQGKDPGYYILTPRGADFLFRNLDVPRVAIIEKRTHNKKFYWHEEEDRVTFGELMKRETPWWIIETFNRDFYINPQLSLEMP